MGVKNTIERKVSILRVELLLPFRAWLFPGPGGVKTHPLIYRIVASRSTSRLVTCLGLFRLLMKGIFGPYVL